MEESKKSENGGKWWKMPSSSLAGYFTGVIFVEWRRKSLKKLTWFRGPHILYMVCIKNRSYFWYFSGSEALLAKRLLIDGTSCGFVKLTSHAHKFTSNPNIPPQSKRVCSIYNGFRSDLLGRP